MIRRFFPLLALALVLAGCAALQQVMALRQVAWAIGKVSDGRLAGVPLSRIASVSDLTTADAARLALAVSRGTAPLDFVVGVQANNPESNGTATLMRLDWMLLLDNKETIRGVLDSSYALPPGQPVTIPLRMQLDLRQFFDGGYDEIVNLALGLVGASNDPTRITLELLPHIDTPLGPITAPSPIRVSGTPPSLR
ncbi:MAG TPA: hypothetical protein PLL69_05325 [Gemmatimonadales bacterium]|nr:hypothetical protein [Gemmatimonadales bacterium]